MRIPDFYFNRILTGSFVIQMFNIQISKTAESDDVQINLCTEVGIRFFNKELHYLIKRAYY